MLGLGFTGCFTFKARIRNRLGSLVCEREGRVRGNGTSCEDSNSPTPHSKSVERYSIQLTAPLNPPNTLLLYSPPNLPPLVVSYSGVSLGNLVVFGTVFVRNGFRFALVAKRLVFVLDCLGCLGLE